MVKTTKSIKVLLNIGGPESVKELIGGDRRKIELDMNDPIHAFLISECCRKYRSFEHMEELFGIRGVDRNNEIVQKIKERQNRIFQRDPLTDSQKNRRTQRIILFKRKSYKMAKSLGRVFFRKWLGSSRALYKTRRSSNKHVFECFIKNGKLEVKYV